MIHPERKSIRKKTCILLLISFQQTLGPDLEREKKRGGSRLHKEKEQLSFEYCRDGLYLLLGYKQKITEVGHLTLWRNKEKVEINMREGKAVLCHLALPLNCDIQNRICRSRLVAAYHNLGMLCALVLVDTFAAFASRQFHT